MQADEGLCRHPHAVVGRARVPAGVEPRHLADGVALARVIGRSSLSSISSCRRRAERENKLVKRLPERGPKLLDQILKSRPSVPGCWRPKCCPPGGGRAAREGGKGGLNRRHTLAGLSLGVKFGKVQCDAESFKRHCSRSVPRQWNKSSFTKPATQRTTLC